jgi:hypothetical protein
MKAQQNNEWQLKQILLLQQSLQSFLLTRLTAKGAVDNQQ